VDLTADATRDSIGARVAGVTPNGPADRANVRTGDIVVRINGARLAALAGRADTPDDQSRPGLRLIEIASRLDEGDTVRLELRRDSRPMTVTFQAGESDADVIVQRFREAMPFMGEKLQMSPFEGAGGRVSIRALAGISEALADLELVKVNAGLGEYFGTAEGLLVVDTPDSSSLGLRAGDVILTIGGRRPTSPAHAMRILGTYDAGESVAFEVMRQKHRITVNGRMPAEDHRWRTIHNSLELLPVTPLLPSVAPTAPSAPAVPLMPELPHRSSVVRIVMDEEV
jgi:S1-C subfamily serine protease